MTPDELVEKVARAILAYDEANHDMLSVSVHPEGRATEFAQAAIAAIREALAEPTPEMREAGCDAWRNGRGEYVEIWQAILAASPLGERREG